MKVLVNGKALEKVPSLLEQDRARLRSVLRDARESLALLMRYTKADYSTSLSMDDDAEDNLAAVDEALRLSDEI